MKQKTLFVAAVMVEPDGVLKATAVAAVKCENGDIGLLFLDRDGAEFARAPLSVGGVQWLRGQLAALIEAPEEP